MQGLKWWLRIRSTSVPVKANTRLNSVSGRSAQEPAGFIEHWHQKTLISMKMPTRPGRDAAYCHSGGEIAIDAERVSGAIGDPGRAAIWFIAAIRLYLDAKGIKDRRELGLFADQLDRYAGTLPEQDGADARRAAGWARRLLTANAPDLRSIDCRRSLD